MKTQKISDTNFITSTPDYERYVMIHSSEFANVLGEPIKNTSNESKLEGLVKISYNGKSVYRKCIGRNIQSKIIQIGYRTLSELGIEYETKVNVESATWFTYYWHNSDSYFKYPFRIAFVATIVSVLSLFVSIASLIIDIF